MKIILGSFLLLLTIVATAQNESVEVLSKGTKFIGGSFFFSLDVTSEQIPDIDDYKYKTSSISFGPVAGKYIKDNLAHGLTLTYNFQSSKDEYPDDTEYKSFGHFIGAGYFIRKNYKIVPNLFFFLQAQSRLTYGASKSIDVNEDETKFRNYSFSLGGLPGLQLFLSKKWSLETSLGLVGYSFRSSKTVDSDSKTNSHNVDFGGGLGSINFSVRYFIHP